MDIVVVDGITPLWLLSAPSSSNTLVFAGHLSIAQLLAYESLAMRLYILVQPFNQPNNFISKGRNAYCTIGYSACRVWSIHPLMLIVSHPRRIPGKVKSVLLCISSHCQSPSNPKSIILGCLLNFVSDSWMIVNIVLVCVVGQAAGWVRGFRKRKIIKWRKKWKSRDDA